MYSINYNSLKNCIYVVVEGNLTMEDANKYIEKFKTTANSAKPHFNVCTDLSKAAVVLPEVNEKLGEAKTYAETKGYNKCAFIVDSAVFKMQIKRVFAEQQESFFTNKADAENFLNN